MALSPCQYRRRRWRSVSDEWIADAVVDEDGDDKNKEYVRGMECDAPCDLTKYADVTEFTAAWMCNRRCDHSYRQRQLHDIQARHIPTLYSNFNG